MFATCCAIELICPAGMTFPAYAAPVIGSKIRLLTS
jgi:hypothetical protein